MNAKDEKLQQLQKAKRELQKAEELAEKHDTPVNRARVAYRRSEIGFLEKVLKALFGG